MIEKRSKQVTVTQQFEVVVCDGRECFNEVDMPAPDGCWCPLPAGWMTLPQSVREFTTSARETRKILCPDCTERIMLRMVKPDAK